MGKDGGPNSPEGYQQRERERQAAIAQAQAAAQAQAEADERYYTQNSQNSKGYTPTDKDFTNPFGTSYTKQPLDATGRPLQPEFRSIGDKDTGLLQDPYMIKEQLDPRAMEAARGEAYRDPGTQSKWRQMAQAQGANDIARNQAGQMAQAKNSLAMSGGLRSGARERLASQSMQGGLAARQNMNSQLGMADESNRQKWMQQMPGMELATAQHLQGTQGKNIQNTMLELAQKRMAENSNYTGAMKEWGAINTARATPSGGKK